MLDSIKTEGVEMPVKACSAVYRKIEKQNDFSFNVYTCEFSTAGNYPIYPIYLTNNMKPTHVNLLLYYEDTDEGCKKHYIYIKNFNRLFYDITNEHNKKHFCVRCLHHFSSEELLNKHNKDYPSCVTDPVKTVYQTKEEAFIEFEH